MRFCCMNAMHKYSNTFFSWRDSNVTCIAKSVSWCFKQDESKCFELYRRGFLLEISLRAK